MQTYHTRLEINSYACYTLLQINNHQVTSAHVPS